MRIEIILAILLTSTILLFKEQGDEKYFLSIKVIWIKSSFVNINIWQKNITYKYTQNWAISACKIMTSLKMTEVNVPSKKDINMNQIVTGTIHAVITRECENYSLKKNKYVNALA